jgi:hypothetical protein
MTTTQPVTFLTFHTAKHGRRYATYFGQHGRNFRLAIAEAEFMIATGTGIEEPPVKY